MYKLIFMGTPEFAVASLRALVESKKYEIVAVVSQPDRPRGRGKKIVPTPVKAYAEAWACTVLQPV
jgi:methionyl-tRNA formyltransferase